MSVPALKDRLKQASSFAGAVASASPLGKILFVDSSAGSDGNPGLDELHPLLTLTQAIALADAGDTIVCNPGGSETVTATLAVAVAGLKIVCPAANSMSGFTVSGAGTLALMTVSAADCHVEGLHFVHTGSTASAAGILTTAAADRLTVKRCAFDDSQIVTTFTGYGVEVTNLCHDVLIEDCLFLDPQFGVLFTMDTSSIALRPKIRGCTFYVGRATAFGINTALTGSGGVRGLVVDRCHFVEANGLGAAATTAWDGTDGTNATVGPIRLAAACDQFLVTDCRASSIASVVFSNLVAVVSGGVGDIVRCDAAYGGSTDTNVTQLGVDLAVVDGYFDVPTADAATDATIRDVVGRKTDAGVQAVTTTKSIMAYLKGTLDVLAGTTGISTFPASAAPANNVSMAEVLRQVYDQTGIGSEFWLKKTLVSSAILQASVDVTGVSSGGELAIEDVVVKSDATGLAAMTNFELETNNAKGLPDFFVTVASGLGASKTIDLANASVTKIKTVLESGAKVIARASAADGTGAGTVDIYIKFRRLAAAATIAAA